MFYGHFQINISCQYPWCNLRIPMIWSNITSAGFQIPPGSKWIMKHTCTHKTAIRPVGFTSGKKSSCVLRPHNQQRTSYLNKIYFRSIWFLVAFLWMYSQKITLFVVFQLATLYQSAKFFHLAIVGHRIVFSHNDMTKVILGLRLPVLDLWIQFYPFLFLKESGNVRYYLWPVCCLLADIVAMQIVTLRRKFEVSSFQLFMHSLKFIRSILSSEKLIMELLGCLNKSFIN